MKKMGVWEKIPKSRMPPNKRCVKHKWVLNIKRNGVFRARLVACGYSQIPGVDFTENFAPVINDVTYRILLILSIMKGYKPVLIDVETAFLHGDLDEEIYMECPKGLPHYKDEVLLLKKSLYGLVQAARQYNLHWTGVLKNIGLKQSPVDPCLFVGSGPIFVGTYVDDNMIIGDASGVDNLINNIKKSGLKLTIEESLEDYLSCEIVFSEMHDREWIGQPHLIQRLIERFGDKVKKFQRYLTPGSPNTGIRLVKDDEEKLCRRSIFILLWSGPIAISGQALSSRLS